MQKLTEQEVKEWIEQLKSNPYIESFDVWEGGGWIKYKSGHKSIIYY